MTHGQLYLSPRAWKFYFAHIQQRINLDFAFLHIIIFKNIAFKTYIS